jgi:hypothetical protein
MSSRISPNEPFTRQRRGCDSGLCGPSGMQTLVPGAVLDKLEAARRHGNGNALCHRQRACVETQQPARRQGRCEHADDPRRVEADLMKSALRHRCNPCCRLDADHIGRHHVAAGGSDHRRRRQHSRKYARGWVNDARHVCVVEIEPVAEVAVEDRCVASRKACGKTDHRNAALAAEAAHGVQHAVRVVIA